MAPKRKSQSTTLETKKKQCVSGGLEAGTEKTSFKQNQSTGKKIDYDKNFISASKVKVEPTSPDKPKEKPTDKPSESANLTLNQIIQKKSQLSMLSSIAWKAFVFPSSNSVDNKPVSQEYFGLDLVELKSDRTYWTHKPSTWQNVFDSVNEYAKSGNIVPISSIFNGILSCTVRALPKGPNEIQTFKTGSNQTIQHWIMLVPMPANIVSNEYIKSFVEGFQTITKRSDIRSGYHEGVCLISQNYGMRSQVEGDGSYWTIFDDASEREIIIQHCTCLSNILCDFTIKVVVKNMFGIDKARTSWPEAIEEYAYGEK